MADLLDLTVWTDAGLATTTTACRLAVRDATEVFILVVKAILGDVYSDGCPSLGS